MRNWPRIFLIVLIATSVSAEAQLDNQLEQQQRDQIRVLQLQNDAALARIQADTERLLQDMESKRVEAKHERRVEELREALARRSAAESAAAKKAEDVADDMREEMRSGAVRSADAVYSTIAIGLLTLFGVLVAKKAAKEGSLKYEQKFGVVFMVFAILLSVVAITISDTWDPRFDALQNVMGWLRVRFVAEYDSEYAPRMIDIPTKYVVAALMAIFAYGFTTYLGITPAWKRAAKPAPPPGAISEN